MKLTRIALAAGAVALLAGATACSSGTPSSDTTTGGDPITIGVILPLSGNLGGLGKQMLDGYQVAVDVVNGDGGIDGRPVELKVSDAPTPEDAVGVAQQLANDPDVQIVMGTNSSSIAIPASEVVSRAGKIYWETGAAAADITERGLPGVFRTSPSVALPAYADATPDFLNDAVAPALGVPVTDLRMGLIYAEDDFGTATAKTFRDIADREGYDLVVDTPYAANAQDLSGTIGQLIDADVQILVAVSNITDAILIAQQSDELGFSPELIFGNGSGWTAKDTIDALGPEINGIVVGDAVPLNIDGSLPNADVSPSYDEFADAYRGLTGNDPGTPGTNGYFGAMVLFQDVLPDADPADPQSISAAASDVDIPDGGTVAMMGVKFDETGQNERAKWFIHQFQNGKPVPVYPLELAGADLVLPMSDAPGR